ncbi:hypothetical protein SARC_13553, partial [Sphaeroforma arctica JP610]
MADEENMSVPNVTEWANVSFTDEQYQKFPELAKQNDTVNYTQFSNWIQNLQQITGPSSEKLHHLDSAAFLALGFLLLLTLITIW